MDASGNSVAKWDVFELHACLREAIELRVCGFSINVSKGTSVESRGLKLHISLIFVGRLYPSVLCSNSSSAISKPLDFIKVSM